MSKRKSLKAIISQYQQDFQNIISNYQKIISHYNTQINQHKKEKVIQKLIKQRNLAFTNLNKKLMEDRNTYIQQECKQLFSYRLPVVTPKDKSPTTSEHIFKQNLSNAQFRTNQCINKLKTVLVSQVGLQDFW